LQLIQTNIHCCLPMRPTLYLRRIDSDSLILNYVSDAPITLLSLKFYKNKQQKNNFSKESCILFATVIL
jgi:hypothetical protein